MGVGQFVVGPYAEDVPFLVDVEAVFVLVKDDIRGLRGIIHGEYSISEAPYCLLFGEKIPSLGILTPI
jgi:hypothetical protein